MSPLFENEDWPRPGGPDVPVPSFLRDDSTGIPGPADVSFAFQVQGPSYDRIAPPSRPAASGYSSGYAFAVPASPGWPGERSFSVPSDFGPCPEPSDMVPADPGGPDWASAYSQSAYSEPDRAETDGPASSVWDPLFDPWPPPGPGTAHGEPGWQPTGQPAWDHLAGQQAWGHLPGEPLWDQLAGQPAWDQLPSDHPSGPLPRTPVGPDWSTGSADDYDVTLTGALGYADLGFRDGWWFSLGGSVPRPITTRDALRAHPELGGPIVQVVCWWMRENAADPRALDLATELALAVGELSREAAGLVR